LASEFELIDLFKGIGSEYYKENGVIIPPGDDCAIIDLSQPIITSVDASVAGVHFPLDANSEDIAYRSIAVALSDLAAMGCNPRAFSLSVTSPETNIDWYKRFALGTKEIAEKYKISLIGGDVTKGPMNINVIVYGTAYKSKVLKRSEAKVGDFICISSQVGRAAKGLSEWLSGNTNSIFVRDYLKPIPKFELGKSIIESATACIDTSDGLLADLEKMLRASKCGAIIQLDDIPITSDINDINAGDDYDLCFTIPKDKYNTEFYKIGEVTKETDIKLISHKGYDVNIKGYEHFRNE
jgi:thiamine-monophosphate kinase